MPGGGPAGWLEPDRSPPTMMDWLRKLRDDLRAHRQSFAISLLATVLGLGLYGYTYLAEAKTWLPQLIDSVELKTYDARFKIRGQVRSSPDIVIVAIDQKTLDDLGAWPFSRVHYARMLENLKKAGGEVGPEARAGRARRLPAADAAGPARPGVPGPAGRNGAAGGHGRAVRRLPPPRGQGGAGAAFLLQPRRCHPPGRGAAEGLRRRALLRGLHSGAGAAARRRHRAAAAGRDLHRAGGAAAAAKPARVRRRGELQLRLLQLRA